MRPPGEEGGHAGQARVPETGAMDVAVAVRYDRDEMEGE